MSSTNTATAPPAKPHPQTGPRTPEGKARSSQNARKHGLTSATPFIAPEDRPAYDELEAAMRHEANPSGVFQEIAFLAALANAWNLQRITRLEAQSNDTQELARLQRYRTAAERGHYRAIKELATQQSDAITAPFYRKLFAERMSATRNPAEMTDEEFFTPEELQALHARGATAEERFARWQEEQAQQKPA